MHTNLSIIGSGGHAKVVVESLNFSRSDIKVKIFDENRSTLDLLLGKYSVEFLEDWTDLDNYFMSRLAPMNQEPGLAKMQ